MFLGFLDGVIERKEVGKEDYKILLGVKIERFLEWD